MARTRELSLQEPPVADRVPRWPFVMPRVYVGIVFAVAGVEQLLDRPPWVDPGQTWSEALRHQLSTWAPHSAIWYRGVLAHVLLPQSAWLAPLVAIVHVVLGCLLVCGCATRLAAGALVVLLANYLAMSGQTPYGGWTTAAYLALALTVLLARAGRMWGLDVIFARRWPRSRLW